MFERFTNQSRRVVVLAQEEARMLDHNYIGTEHLLLGLLREGKGPAARALEATGVTLDAARAQVVSIVGRGQQQPSGHIPFTPRAKRSLELALTETMQLGDDYIGTGHLLLGLIRQGDSMAVKILGELSADLKDLRARVIQDLRDHPEKGRKPAPQPAEREQRQVRLFLRDEVRGLLDTIDERLTAIEQRLHITRPVSAELTSLDEQIARVRQDKEAAVDVKDFGRAAALRDEEKRLIQERARVETEIASGAGGSADAGAGGEAGAGAAAGSDGEPDEVRRLRDRVASLEARLREHGIDTGEAGEAGEAPAAG